MRWILTLLLLSATTYAQNPDFKVWDKNNKLKWSDFAGPVDKNIPYFANTRSGPYYSYQLHSRANGRYELLFNVECRFYKNLSWVVHSEESAAMLAHEQTHFDISEFFTRVLSTRFYDTDFTANYKQETAKIYDDIMVQLSVMQHTFDYQTSHSMNTDREEEWERYVENILNKSYDLKKALEKMPRP